MGSKNLSIVMAILAAMLYAVSVPLSKLFLGHIEPVFLAGALYMGAGLGSGFMMLSKKIFRIERTKPYLNRHDFPCVVIMVVLDIAASVFLMQGIMRVSSANVSLLGSFEIATTSIIALIFFREKISSRMWLAVLFVTLASIILGFEGSISFSFSKGSLFVMCACVCWGIENNCTRSISGKDSEEIVLIKGIFSGAGSLVIAFLLSEQFPEERLFMEAMLLGFVSYGLSVNLYVSAQKELGASKTSALYSMSPFLGVGFSFILLGERPEMNFFYALLLMVLGVSLVLHDTLVGSKKLLVGFYHTHEHRHRSIVHTHMHRHLIYSPLHFHSHKI